MQPKYKSAVYLYNELVSKQKGLVCQQLCKELQFHIVIICYLEFHFMPGLIFLWVDIVDVIPLYCLNVQFMSLVEIHDFIANLRHIRRFTWNSVRYPVRRSARKLQKSQVQLTFSLGIKGYNIAFCN